MDEPDRSLVPAAVQTGGTAPSGRQPRLIEVDLLRSVTALAVVGVHVTAFTVALNRSQAGVQAQDAVVALLHFTREIFLSITALVLVYRYAHRPFSASAFWRRRGLGVLLPYVVWSLLYSWLNRPHTSALRWLGLALGDLLTGSASYQLYFILLTLQLYLILPALLRLLTRVEHPWRLLAGSFVLQLALLTVDFVAIQAGPFAATRLGALISTYQGRYLPLYQLYVVLGAVAALHIERLRAFVLQHGRWIDLAGLFGAAVYLGHYLVAVRLGQRSVDYETSVFQPAMALYATTTALFLYRVSATWAARGKPGQPPGFRFWGLLSSASFGVYLVHPLILAPALDYLVPALPAIWPVAARVFLTWLAVAAGSVFVSVVLLHTPLLSRLVGQPYTPLRRAHSPGTNPGATATVPPARREPARSATETGGNA
jgi:surface polysaccharide O-acyltransferase-like enzyme